MCDENVFTDADLEAYLDEMLHPEEAAQIEAAVRQDPTLLQRLAMINSRRNAGVHTLGEIWRRNQIGIPTAEEMGQYVMGALSPERADYIDFRLKVLKCRITLALHRDMLEKSREVETPEASARQKKYFDSSAGLLQQDEE